MMEPLWLEINRKWKLCKCGIRVRLHWVYREPDLMFTLSSDKRSKKKLLSHSLSLCKWTLMHGHWYSFTDIHSLLGMGHQNVFENNYQLRHRSILVADPGFPKRGGGANPWFRSKNLLFGKTLAENCNKIKDIEPIGVARPLDPPMYSVGSISLHFI